MKFQSRGVWIKFQIPIFKKKLQIQKFQIPNLLRLEFGIFILEFILLHILGIFVKV